jgi:ABC-type Fe3+-hydroxamate transport system substrate-binding protein
MHIFALLLALCLPGCGGEGEARPTPDAAGPSIAVLSPALAIILDDLGRADRIVARHAFDDYTDRSVPVAGDQSGVDYELLARAEPTHVLLEWGARDLPRRLAELADSRGWVVVDYPMLTLDDIRAATRDLGTRFDADERAAELLEQMDNAWLPAPELAERAGRTLPLYWTNPVGAAGPGSFHHQLLAAIGVAPALDEGGAYIEIDPEDLRRLDPDTIVLFAPNADPSDLDDILAPLRRLELRAVGQGRVVLINDPWCQTPSTAMIEVAEQTREALSALPALD